VKIQSRLAAGNNKIMVLDLLGRVDAFDAPDFEKELKKLLDSGQCYLILNLQNTTYVSSSGLSVILRIAKEARNNRGDLRLMNLNPTVRDTFEIAGFHRIIRVFPNEMEAVASFQDIFSAYDRFEIQKF